MKSFILTLALAASISCLAEDYHVPAGFYSGHGKWADNHGQTGDWTMTIQISEKPNGYHEEFTSQLSDGRSYSGSPDFVFGENSYFTYITNVNGNEITIGHGVAAPGSYAVTDLALNQNEYIMEFGSYKKRGPWNRHGTIFDRTNGRATQYEIKELRLKTDAKLRFSR